MPNEDKFHSFSDPDAIPGVVCKAASVQSLEVTEEDLKKINKYALSPLSAEDVFIFKAVIADNEQDDRNYMPFNLKALQDLKDLYPGKTMLKDHARKADNQIGRVFDTELVQNTRKKTELGEIHTELIAKIYMIKTASNADLIAEISGGIKKEVSTSCTPAKMVCNICGTDNLKDWCRHYPGFDYDVTDQATGKASKKRCKMLLHGAKDAYEVSLVAVPAQPRAGTHKSIGFTKPIEAPTPEEDPEETEKKDAEIRERIENARIESSFYFTKNQEVKDNE